jgi:hypothetical protein
VQRARPLALRAPEVVARVHLESVRLRRPASEAAPRKRVRLAARVAGLEVEELVALHNVGTILGRSVMMARIVFLPSRANTMQLVSWSMINSNPSIFALMYSRFICSNKVPASNPMFPSANTTPAGTAAFHAGLTSFGRNSAGAHAATKPLAICLKKYRRVFMQSVSGSCDLLQQQAYLLF